MLTRGDVTFYVTTLASVAALFRLLWILTVGAALKRLEKEMKNQLEPMLTTEVYLKGIIDLREWMRKEFVAKK